MVKVSNRNVTRSKRRPQNAPKRPRDLPRSTHKLWSLVVEHLDELGILSPDVGPRLEIYCLAQASYRRASAYLRRYGITSRYQPQAWQVMRQAGRILSRFHADYGLTPLARHRLKRRGVITAEAIERVTCRPATRKRP